MRSATLLALAASLSSTLAVYQGFNYGSTFNNGAAKTQADFTNEFKAAQNLVGTSGFTSARLYTMIVCKHPSIVYRTQLTFFKQAGTQNDIISAIQAAIDTKTTLLLGMWASAGPGPFADEIVALKAAIAKYGPSLASIVTGLSVGSEDLYRISPTGLAAPDAAPGADPATLVNYINQVKSAIQGTALSGVRITHVDTWTAWVNGSNADVVKAVDFVSTDAYPYFQSAMANGIDQNARLFQEAYDATVAAAQGKDVWVTETGYPVSGKTSGAAVPGLTEAKRYWDEVGCAKLFNKINTYWYTLQDSFPNTPNPSFGIVGSTLSTTPLFDLSCPAAGSVSAASASTTSAGSSQASGAASGSSSSAAGAGGASAAATAVVSGGLSPGSGAGNGVVSSAISATTSAPVDSSVATLPAKSNTTTLTTAVSGGNGTVATGAPKSSSTSTGPASVSSSGAGSSSGSMIGAIGAIVALVAAL
jgi:glucan endo-1,3-beta-D-glucosidase